MTHRPIAALATALLVLAAAGCSHVDEHAAAAHDAAAGAVHDAADAATDAAATLDPAAREAAVAAVLRAADALDGTTDKVVARCPGCSLAMDGKAEHAHAVGEYELHFCSASCAEHFTADTEGKLLALKVPETP